MAKTDLTAERLRELFVYNEETGIFTRRIATGHRGCHRAGEVAGCLDNKGYVKIYVDLVQYCAHRLAWLYMTGEWPHNEIDHKNTIRNDNSWANLRDATSAQNKQNMRKARKDNVCGLLGVSICRGIPYARIMVDGKQKRIGSFDTPENAHVAYLKAKKLEHEFQTIT